MTLLSLRRLAVAATTLALTAGTAVAVAPDAAAALGKPSAVGDLTADGISDRFWLSGAPGDPTRCGYVLQAGLGGGRFAAPVRGALPVRDAVPAGERARCPGLAVVLTGPTPAQNLVATSFNGIVGPYRGPSGQVFGGFATGDVRLTGTFGAQGMGDQLLSPADFDGDGFSDLYEPAGQYSARILVGRGPNIHEIWSSSGANDSDLQFRDLNLAGGTDILAVDSRSGFDTTVEVVDGRTGARQTLADTNANPDLYGTEYTLTVVDVDHNRYPDLQLVGRQAQPDGTTVTTTRKYVNASAGGRWYFRPLAATTG